MRNGSMLLMSLPCRDLSPRVKTKSEYLENAKDGLESYIESLKKHNEPIHEDAGEEVILNA